MTNEKYINADTVKLDIRRYLMPNVDDDGTVTVENAERYFLNLLDNAPAADVVEVVRCKDCLFGHKEHDYKCGYICKKPLYYPAIGEIPHRKLMHDCDYCSHGVRKTN